MHIEQLVTMANDIAAFFLGASDREDAVRDLATHLRRYWDPRMRKQIIDHCNAGGAGLSDLAREAIGTLAAPVSSPRS
jgi:formate dehydrogenase subunit delta